MLDRPPHRVKVDFMEGAALVMSNNHPKRCGDFEVRETFSGGVAWVHFTLTKNGDTDWSEGLIVRLFVGS